MKIIHRLKSFRFICYALAFLTATPTFTMLTPLPAPALELKEMIQVAAVDFINRTGVGGDYIGKIAADALVVELKNSDRFDPLGRSVVLQGMEKLGLRPPLSRSQLLRLGEEVLKGDLGQTSAMLEGDVTSIKISGQPRRASVEINVRIVELLSGEVINGAVATGRSQLRIGDSPDEDWLIQEAINDAAYQAVKTMVDYIIPRATVQNTLGTNEVLLNKGAREGLRRGMKMIVFRHGELVGKVEVRDVTPNDATATIIHAPKGVKPEDKVQAVFDVKPVRGGGVDVPVESPKTGRAKAPKEGGEKMGSAKKLLYSIAAIGGLIWIFNGNRGTEKVGAVSAQAGMGPDIPFPPDGGIKVSWDRSDLAKGRNILEFHIWRDNEPTPVGSVVPAGIKYFVDDVGATPRSVTYSVVDPFLNTKTSATVSVPRAPTGIPHQYYVSVVYQIEKPAGSGTYKYFETDKSPTGLATITRKMTAATDLVQPAMDATDVDPALMQFQFRSRRGADTYIIQVSATSTFSTPLYTSTIINFSPDLDDVLITYDAGNISSQLGSVSAGNRVWWRVGCRNSLDTPGPVRAGGVPGMNFLFSEAGSFMVEDAPPSGP